MGRSSSSLRPGTIAMSWNGMVGENKIFMGAVHPSRKKLKSALISVGQGWSSPGGGVPPSCMLQFPQPLHPWNADDDSCSDSCVIVTVGLESCTFDA